LKALKGKEENIRKEVRKGRAGRKVLEEMKGNEVNLRNGKGGKVN